MAVATDLQMQQYANERLRVRAEQARAFFAALRDDKAAIEDIYARAVSETPWNDDRDDGPPTLLTHQDMLVYNSVASLLLACIDNAPPQGMTAAQVLTDLNANWSVFQGACVRPLPT